MPVSLYGQPADMDQINAIAEKHDLKVIIDGAQSFGATYKGKTEVHHCDIFTTSFFPAKPLGCYGDGGAVLTNDDVFAEKIRMLRVHGQNQRYHHKYIGMGGRLDTLQAAILLAKLPHYQEELKARNEVAMAYCAKIGSADSSNAVRLPRIKDDRMSAWAQFTLQVHDREKLQENLKQAGIPTAIHYPMPLHRQKCFSYLGMADGSLPVAERASEQVLSLPMNAYMVEKKLDYAYTVFR